MALHGRRNHSGKRSTGSTRRSLNFECLERRSLLSAVGFGPAVPWNDAGLAALVSGPQPARSEYANSAQGTVNVELVVANPNESTAVSESAGAHSTVSTEVTETSGPNFSASTVVSQVAGTTVAATVENFQPSAPGLAATAVTSVTAGPDVASIAVMNTPASMPASSMNAAPDSQGMAVVQIQSPNFVLTLDVFSPPSEARLFDPPPADLSRTPTHGDIQYGNSLPDSPAADVSNPPQFDPGAGGHAGDTPAEHLPALPTMPTPDADDAQHFRHDMVGPGDTTSANSPAGNESSPGTESVSGGINGSTSTNSMPTAYTASELQTLAEVQIQTPDFVFSLYVGDLSEQSLFDTPPVDVGHTPTRGIQNGNPLPSAPAPDASNATQVAPGSGSYDGETPSPRLPSVNGSPAAQTADHTSEQSAKDDIFALGDPASAASPAGNETSPGTESVSAESNLSTSTNSIQDQGNPIDGVANASATKAIEGGFIALDDGTSTVTRLAANGNAASRADLGNIDGGPVAIEVTSGAPKQSGDWISSGRTIASDNYAPAIGQAASQPSLDATEGGAIDLTDAAQAGAASETADTNDGNSSQANSDIRSESGVALFCDMEVAVGASTSDELPVPAVPIAHASLPAGAQGENPGQNGQNVKPSRESVRRVDPRQRVSTGLSDAAPLIAGAAMLVLSNGVELEPAEREPKRRFLGIKRLVDCTDVNSRRGLRRNACFATDHQLG